MSPRKFFLGTHHPNWLGEMGVPLCVSRATLTRRASFPRALGPWMLDSGAFSELAAHGRWTITAKEYAAQVRHFSAEIGPPVMVAPQDWMCEPHMLKKTGLSVGEHQALTTRNYLELRALGAPVFPVLQGFAVLDYLRHVEEYARAGVHLERKPVVGVGSVCRRQADEVIVEVLRPLAQLGIRLHGFGVKAKGLAKAGALLSSADSMAWSFRARRSPPLLGCTTHINCANCSRYALRWRAALLDTLAGRRQVSWAF